MLIATKSSKIDLSTEKKTEELASNFYKNLKVGDIVFLHGEMGVGKTTFIRYLINIFQKENEIDLTEVTSPTFNLLSEYQIKHFKLTELPQIIIVKASTHQVVRDVSQGMTSLKNKYPNAIPTNITTLKVNIEQEEEEFLSKAPSTSSKPASPDLPSNCFVLSL